MTDTLIDLLSRIATGFDDGCCHSDEFVADMETLRREITVPQFRVALQHVNLSAARKANSPRCEG